MSPRGAVAQRPGAAGVAGDHAADRARVARAEVERRVEPAPRAAACSAASVVPAPTVTCPIAGSTSPTSFRRRSDSSTSSSRGTPAPTNPVLPPWGTIGTPWLAQTASTPATSLAVAGADDQAGDAASSGR